MHIDKNQDPCVYTPRLGKVGLMSLFSLEFWSTRLAGCGLAGNHHHRDQPPSGPILSVTGDEQV